MKIRKLEAIRGFAAVYVIFHHFIGYSDILKTTLPSALRAPFRFGQEAVMLFFVLSGFVIYLSAAKNPSVSFGNYFLRRFIRIYPLVLVSFVISIIIALVNAYQFSFRDLKILLGNFLMLQDIGNKPGNFVTPFLSNGPLWSLSYEWWFYLLFFPLFVYLYRKKKTTIPSIYFALMISVTGWLVYIFHPNHMLLILAYFVIWWAGVYTAETYVKYKNITFKNMFPALLSLFIMTCLSSIPTVQSYLKGFRNFSQAMFPILPFRHFAFVLVIVLLGILWYRYKLILFDFLFDRFERFAPISYAIYIIHVPLILLQIVIVNPLITLLIKLVFVFVLAYFMELKLQPFINTIFKNLHLVKSKGQVQVTSSDLKYKK